MMAVLKHIAAAILLAQSAAPFGLAPRARAPLARAPRSVALRSTPVDVTDAAVKQIEAFRLSHAGHEPAELGALEKAVAAKAEPQAVGAAMYELLCTSMLDYDRDGDDEEKLVVSARWWEGLPDRRRRRQSRRSHSRRGSTVHTQQEHQEIAHAHQTFCRASYSTHLRT